MKKILFRSLIILVLFIVLSITGYFIYLHLYAEYTEQLTYHASEDVIVVNDLFTTSYLIKSDSGYIAVDCGFNESVMERSFYYNKINPEGIHSLFLTHSDVDHTNNVKLFTKANIYISREEADMINGGSQRFGFVPFLSNKLNLKGVNFLNDGDVLEIAGVKVLCIALPGHTPGSMGYVVNDKYLFTGDAFRIKNGKLEVPYKKMFAMDIDEMKRSLKKVAALKNIKFIFSAHSGFTADFDFAVNNDGILKE